MITYIIITEQSEVYCGKTDNLNRRLKEHLSEKHPHWFSANERKKWMKVYYFEDDLEREIKKFGVLKFITACLCLKVASPDHEMIK